MSYRNVLIIGGAGFVGSHLTAYLAKHFECQITVVARHSDRVKHLMDFPSVGIFVGDIHDEGVLDTVIRNADVVINLVGTLHSKRARRGRDYGADFAAAHVTLTEKIVNACAKHDIKRYIHFSSAGVSDQISSPYIKSKEAGEDAAFGQPSVDVTVFRPTMIFGDGDNALRVFAALQKRLPVMLLTSPDAEFQPVYVGNVVEAIIYALRNNVTVGQVYTLAGPRIYTLRELISMAGEWGHCKKAIWELPASLSFLQRLYYPKAVFSQQALACLQLAGAVVDPYAAQALAAELDMTLTTVEEVAPTYLSQMTRA